jgi:TolB-like protein
MMAKDAEATVRIVDDYNDTVVLPASKAHGGRLITRMGDGWLLEFQVVDEALRFALHTQKEATTALGAMAVRAGLDFGEVIETDSTVHGTGLNTAVRLQNIARPGGITFSSAIHAQLTGDLACQIREIGPRVVKNIPEPIWVYRIVMPDEEDERGSEHGSTVDLTRQVPGLSNRPAIAVLPFENTDGDQEHEYFSEGLTDDIIDGLSRARWFPVISRNSTFAFKKVATDLREIGRQLGARYVVSGRVDISERGLRVHASLAQAEDRHVIWSNRYSVDRRDLFAVRDEIAREIVGAIEPEFSFAEQSRSRARALETLDEWELVRRGVWHMNRLTRQDSLIAAELFTRALMSNPNSVEALVHLSWWHFWDVWVRRGAAEGWSEMASFARRAMALDARDGRAVMLTGIADFMQGETEHAQRMLNRAIDLNPSLAVAHASVGSAHILAGEPELAIDPLRTALRLSPNDFNIFHTLGEVAAARYMMGDYNLAVGAAEESLAVRPGYVHAHVVRIGALARLARSGEARAALDELLKRRPHFHVKDIRWLPFTDRHWITFLMEGLELAGFDKLGNDGDNGQS